MVQQDSSHRSERSIPFDETCRTFRSIPFDETSVVQQKKEKKSFLSTLVSRFAPAQTIPEESQLDVEAPTQITIHAEQRNAETERSSSTALETREGDEEVVDEREFYDASCFGDDSSEVSDISGDLMIRQRYACLKNYKKDPFQTQGLSAEDKEKSCTPCTELAMCGGICQNNAANTMVTNNNNDALDHVFNLLEFTLCSDGGADGLEKAILAAQLAGSKNARPVVPVCRTSSILESSSVKSDISASGRSRRSTSKKTKHISRSKKARAADASASARSSGSVRSFASEEPNNVSAFRKSIWSNTELVQKAPGDYSSKKSVGCSTAATSISGIDSPDPSVGNSAGETTMSGTLDGLFQIGAVVFSKSYSFGVSSFERDPETEPSQSASVSNVKNMYTYQAATMILNFIFQVISSFSTNNHDKDGDDGSDEMSLTEKLQDPVWKGFYAVACMIIFVFWPSHLERIVVESPNEEKVSLLALVSKS